jgi:hypothetical protein
MPAYDGVAKPFKAIVSFASEEDRLRFMDVIGVERPLDSTRGLWSLWWPQRERDDLSALRFAESNGAAAPEEELAS